MNNVYFSSTLMWNATMDEILKKAYFNKFKGIELWNQHFEFRDFCDEEYKRIADMYRLETIVHASSWDLNISSINTGIREASINEIFKSIDLAKRINAKEVTVHPGRQTINTFKEYHIDILRDSLKRIRDYGREQDIEVSLEIMEKIPKELITTDKELKSILEDLYEDFSYTLDIAHCKNEDEAINYINSIKNISKIHISNKIGTKLHTALYDGDYDFNDLLPKLQKYNKPFVIEGFDKSNEFSIINNTIKFLNDF